MLKRFISYYKPHKKMLFLDMLASAIMSGLTIIYPIITRKVLNDYVPNQNYKMVLISGIIVLALYLVKMFLKWFVQYFGHIMGVKMQAQMRRDLFEKLETLPYSYFDENETGKIVTRITNDLQDVTELAHHGPENFLICTVTIIGSLIYLFTINVILSLIILISIPVLVFVATMTRGNMVNAYKESRKSIAEINANITSSVEGIRVTKAFTNSKKEMEKFETGNTNYIKARTKAYGAMAQYHSVSNFVTDFFYIIVLIAGGIILCLPNSPFTITDYSVFIVSVSAFTTPIRTLVNFSEQFNDGVTGFERFVEIMDEKSEYQKKNASQLENVKGKIEIKNLNFSYGEERELLKDITLNIEQGQMVALVGPSGGGKTTICHLIPSFYKVEDDKIFIDGKDINDCTLDSLRKNIGIVQQDVFLFNGSIRENILYGRPGATEEEMIEASKRANIYDYVMSLPDKFDTEIGERGVKLSGGQKQRLSIARVFLKNPPILILDEATSALDNTTEILIQKALNDLCKGRTTLVVAHRLSTIKNADKIVVISDGKIVEEGSHSQLLESNGIYKELYMLQFRLDEVNP